MRLYVLLAGFVITLAASTVFFLQKDAVQNPEVAQAQKAEQTALITACQESAECFKQIILDEIKEDGLSEGFVLLKDIFEQTPSFRPMCHEFTRNMVWNMYPDYADYRQLTFTEATTWCNYGFQQAYPQVLVQSTKNPDEGRAFCDYMTQSLGSVVPGAEAECYRGIGRALPSVLFENIDSVENYVEYLAEQCDRLSENLSNTDACINGIFNGIAVMDLEVDEEDPMKLCRELEPQLSEKCFSNYKGKALPLIQGETPEEIRASLPRIESFFKGSNNAAKDIVFSFGYEWVKKHLVEEGDVESAVAACNALPEGVALFCVWGMSVGITKSGVPNTQYQLLTAFCKAARTDIQNISIEDCPSSQAIGYLHGIYSKEKFAEVYAYMEEGLGTIVPLDNADYYGH